jgi:hypothetical protein
MNRKTNKSSSGALSLIIAICVLATAAFSSAQAFTGPGQGAGSGSGAIGVDASNNLSLGTATPQASTKFYIVAPNTSSANYSLRIVQPSLTPIFAVRNDGRVGIATETPGYTLEVNGTMNVTGAFTAGSISGPFSGTINASNVTAGVFGAGNFSFPSSLGIATTTQVGLPQPLSVYGNAYVSANLAVGKITPAYAVDVNGTVNMTGFRMTTGAALNRVLTSDASGNGTWAVMSGLPSGSTSQTLRHDGSNWVASSNILNDATNVGIGGSPSYKLDIAGAMRLQAASQPTGANGVMYYDSTLGKFRCYEAGAWTDCISSGGASLPSGTSGQTLRHNGTTWVANSVIYNDGTSVGIGTTSPGTKLHLAGSGISTDLARMRIVSSDNQAGIEFQSDATGAVVAYSPDATDDFRVYAGSGDQFAITSAGNTGVGTTAPSYKLDIAGAMRLQAASQPTGANGVMYYDSTLGKFRCYQAGAWTDCTGAATPVTCSGVCTDSKVAKFTVSGGNIQLADTAIYGSGINTGINQMLPSHRLHLFMSSSSDGILLEGQTGTESPVIRIAVTGNARLGMAGTADALVTSTSPGDLVMQTTNGSAVSFATGAPAAIRMRILGTGASTGNVGIGTNGPTSLLYVNGTLTAVTKNFEIPHPTKPGFKLVHSAVEGPEIAVYYRGEGKLENGKAVVKLPDYFDALTRDGSATVQLTPKKNRPMLLSVSEVNGASFVVHGSEPDGAFSWEVKGERADKPQLATERRE